MIIIYTKWKQVSKWKQVDEFNISIYVCFMSLMPRQRF